MGTHPRPILEKPYSFIASMQNLGERIMFSFTAIYADYRGATTSQQGILLSLRNILSFITQQFFGKASDQYGRGLILGVGFFLSMTTSFLLIHLIDPIMIIFIFSFYAIGFSAVQPAWSALIGDTYRVEERSQMLGHIGSIGGLIGGLIYLGVGLYSDKTDEPFELLFFTAAISFLFAFLAVVLLSMKHRIPTQEKRVEKSSMSIFEPLKNNNFKKFVFIDASMAFAMSTTWPLFPKFERSLATTGQISIIWAATFLSFSVTAKSAHKIKKKIGSYKYTLFLTRIVMWIIPATYAFATEWWHLLFSRVIVGLSFGVYQITQKDYILETTNVLSRPQDRGWFFGTHAFVYGIFTFVGSLSSGFATDYLTSNTSLTFSNMFLITAFLRIVFAFGFLLLFDPKINGIGD